MEASWWDYIVGKKVSIDLLNAGWPWIFNLWEKKKTVSVKCNKMRYMPIFMKPSQTSIWSTFFLVSSRQFSLFIMTIALKKKILNSKCNKQLTHLIQVRRAFFHFFCCMSVNWTQLPLKGIFVASKRELFDLCLTCSLENLRDTESHREQVPIQLFQ